MHLCSACNYNENANFDDGSCIYAEVNFDCEGNCVVEIDCHGNAMVTLYLIIAIFVIMIVQMIVFKMNVEFGAVMELMQIKMEFVII